MTLDPFFDTFLPARLHARIQRNRRIYKSDKKPCDWAEEPYNAVESEKRLWRAVIFQAMTDALSHSKRPDDLEEKSAAIFWLIEENDHFLEVCSFAGINPSWLRKHAKRFIANPPLWRTLAGESERYEARKALRNRQKQEAAKQSNAPFRASNPRAGSATVIHFPQVA